MDMVNLNRGHAEPWGIFLIVFGIILSVLILGFFSTNNNNEQVLVSEKICGIVVLSPLSGDVFKNGNYISGHAMGCGWNLLNGNLGSVTLYRFDGANMSLPAAIQPRDLNIESGNSYYFKFPYFFTLGDGKSQGYLKFVSNSGLTHIVPVTF